MNEIERVYLELEALHKRGLVEYSPKYIHEIDRIKQFIKESNGDPEVLRKKLLTRAGRCSQEKLQRFIVALEEMQLSGLANYIKAVMIK